MLRRVRGLGQRRVEQRLYATMRAPSMPARGREHDPRPGVVDAHGELVRREAAEHDRVDRAEARAGQHGHERLGHHRQVEDDAIAALDAEAARSAPARRATSSRSSRVAVDALRAR